MTERVFARIKFQTLYIIRLGEGMTVNEVNKALGGVDNYYTVIPVMRC